MKLNKQLIERLANGEIAVDNSNSNLELLKAVLKEAFLRDNSIPQGKSTYYQKHSKDYWVALEFTILPTIPLSDFLEEEFVLPEKWYCKRTKENSKILNNWNNEKYNDYAFCERGEGCMFSDKHYAGVNLDNYGKYKEITFEQFKKYVLKQETMKKEIIGYKLIKHEYSDAARKIVDLDLPLTVDRITPKTKTHNSTVMYDRLKKAGVLELWFEPVYAASEQIVSMNGKFNLTIKDKKVFHKNEDITDYIEEIGTWWKNVMLEGNLKFAKSYDFLIPSHNIKIMKSGCQSQETYLSDWLKVYDLIK